MSGINDKLNWDLVARRTYKSRKLPKNQRVPIQAQVFIVDSPAIIIGCKNRLAKPSWWLAGNAYQKILTSLSSTSQFIAGVEGSRYKIRLDTLHLIRFPDWQLKPYMLEFKPAFWHDEMLVEVWKYSGDELDGDLARIQTIEQKVNDISAYGL